jgi:hypothetical protein
MLSVLLSIFRSAIYVNSRRNPQRKLHKRVTYKIDEPQRFIIDEPLIHLRNDQNQSVKIFFYPILQSTAHNISASTSCSREVILWIRSDRGNTSSARCRAAISRISAPHPASQHGRSLYSRQRCSIYTQVRVYLLVDA